MLCSRCQHPLDEGAAFCGNCGLRITPEPSQIPQAVAPPVSPVGSAVNQPAQVLSPLAPPQLDAAVASQPLNSYTNPPVPDHSGKAITSFVLAVLGLPACLVPIVGIVFGVLAIVFGTLSIRSARKIFAIIGMSLAVVVLLASLFLWVRNAQELSKEHQTGTSFGTSSANGKLQSITSPCYTTKIPAGMKVTQTAGSCTFLGVNSASGEQEEVKVLQIPALTASNLSTAAKADAANVIGAIPGGSIGKEGTATFASSKAYQIEIKSTDGSAGTISYVYDTTVQGNLVIVLHTQARASGDNYGLSSIESNWSWL